MGWRALPLLLLALGLPATEPPPLITALGDEKFAAREAAEQQLIELAATNHAPVLAACAQAYRQTKDPEVRTRLLRVLETLVDQHLFRVPRGFLGVQLNQVFIGDGGAVVINDLRVPAGAAWIAGVVEGTGAQKAGLQPNDFIIGVDTQRWTSGPAGFTEYVQAKRPGASLKLVVVRGAETSRVEAVLGELPATEQERVYADDRRQAFFERWCEQNLAPAAPTNTP